MRTLVPTLTLVVIVVLAAGCGSKKEETTNAQTAQGTTITIDLKDFSLDPPAVSIPSAGTYTINGVNMGGTSHAIAIEGHGIDQDGATVDPGGTSTVTVDITESGEYEIYCPVGDHAERGMKGTLTLSGPSPAGDNGSTPEDGSGYGR